jgi:hypothetical protein
VDEGQLQQQVQAIQAELSDVRRELGLLDTLLRLKLSPEQQVRVVGVWVWVCVCVGGGG